MTDNWLIQSKRSGLYVVADGDWHDRRHLNIEWVADASKATRFKAVLAEIERDVRHYDPNAMLRVTVQH